LFSTKIADYILKNRVPIELSVFNFRDIIFRRASKCLYLAFVAVAKFCMRIELNFNIKFN